MTVNIVDIFDRIDSLKDMQDKWVLSPVDKDRITSLINYYLSLLDYNGYTDLYEKHLKG